MELSTSESIWPLLKAPAELVTLVGLVDVVEAQAALEVGHGEADGIGSDKPRGTDSRSHCLSYPPTPTPSPPPPAPL